jgi:hypothetical protein
MRMGRALFREDHELGQDMISRAAEYFRLRHKVVRGLDDIFRELQTSTYNIIMTDIDPQFHYGSGFVAGDTRRVVERIRDLYSSIPVIGFSSIDPGEWSAGDRAVFDDVAEKGDLFDVHRTQKRESRTYPVLKKLLEKYQIV